MFYRDERLALFIDGSNLYAATKALGFDIDYKLLRSEFMRRGKMVRAFYYTALVENEEYSPIRPLVDWLDYNGFTLVTKPAKEFVDSSGRRKIKGNMDIELAIDAMEMAGHVEHIVLFSGDGDFRPLVGALQRKGVRVSVVDPPRRRFAPPGRQLHRARRAARRDRPPAPAGAGRGAGRRQRRVSPAETATAPAEPPRDCALCERLVGYRAANRAAHPAWWNGAVASFGDPEARLLVVGLAPGVAGANRTGRPFTGDFAGDLLYGTLSKFGFARGEYAARPDDGLELTGAMVTNAVRCVPPANKPVGAEVNRCRPYLAARIAALPRLSHIVTLGKVAHDSTVRALGARVAAHPFGHGAVSGIDGLAIHASYHCSRYNTNTRRLTPGMFEAVFAAVRQGLAEAP